MWAGLSDEESELAVAILCEFVEDVQVVGVREVRKDWPDIAETYKKAKAFLKSVKYDKEQ